MTPRSSIRQDEQGRWWLGRHPITDIAAKYLIEREPFDRAVDDAVPSFPLERAEITYKRPERPL